jgi:hypothetical protein
LEHVTLPGIDATQLNSLAQTKSGIGSILDMFVERSLKRQFCFRNYALHFGFYCCSANGIAIPAKNFKVMVKKD